jgi:hypothetical protein
MSNIIAKWWRSQQFKSALKRGDTQQAVQILQEIQKSGASFSWLEKLFRDKLKLERYYRDNQKETENLRRKLTISEPKNQLLLKTDADFIKYINKAFNFVQHDEFKLQVTGIDERIFDDFEAILVAFLQEEFSKFSEKQLAIKLEDAFEDINSLKVGLDPDYKFTLTPHVYFMKYFLENVYCLYLAWFLIYEDGLLPSKINILDIASGPGTTAYGLALFLQSCSGFFTIPQMHVSYYSLEKQDVFQYRGLQFWRRYIESRITPVNTYFRFVTSDIFTWDTQSSNVPKNFFDFIVISHCFFSDSVKRQQANNIYREIFAHGLNNEGYVLLVIQDKKLFKAYGINFTEDKEQEIRLVSKFVDEMGLDLVWYKYLTSTDARKPYTAGFAKFAEENLPKQVYMNTMLKKYFAQKHEANYTLDDYIILAKK